MGGWIKRAPGCSPAGTETADHALEVRLEEGRRSRVLSLPELTRWVVRGWGSESSWEWGLRQLAAISGSSVAEEDMATSEPGTFPAMTASILASELGFLPSEPKTVLHRRVQACSHAFRSVFH